MAPKHPTLAAGLLTVLGLIGHATPCVGAPQDPGLGTSAPAAKTPPAPSGPPTVLLLSNGQVRHGEILRDDAGYFVKQKFGTSHYPKRSVDRTFRSLHEAYEYTKSRCPVEDAGERMKLANWCLGLKLVEEAKIELLAVQELSPENRQAKVLLAGLDRAATNPGTAVDEGIVLAGVDVETPAPADLSLMKLREEYARNPRGAGMPVVFDLDVPLAVRRYGEYARIVHPILQRRCAKCHNENTPGDFQLVQTRTSRDLGNDLILRANLEATLRIVDQSRLSRSPILTASGMVHGSSGKPVLGGPNTAEYRTLAAWVTSLKQPDPTTNPVEATATTASAGTDQFASGRLGSGADPAMPPPRKTPIPEPQTGHNPLLEPAPVDLGPDRAVVTEEGVDSTYIPAPAGSLIPGSASGMPQDVPPPEAFLPPDTVTVNGRKVPLKPTATAPTSKLPPGVSRLADGSLVMKHPETGENIPFISQEDQTRKSKDSAKKGKTYDKKVLDSFMKARPK